MEFLNVNEWSKVRPGTLTYLRNCFKNILTFKLLFPSRRAIWNDKRGDDERGWRDQEMEEAYTSVGSLLRFSASELVPWEEQEVAGNTGGTCWQKRPSISAQSISAIGEFWCSSATKDQMLRFPITCNGSSQNRILVKERKKETNKEERKEKRKERKKERRKERTGKKKGRKKKER